MEGYLRRVYGKSSHEKAVNKTVNDKFQNELGKRGRIPLFLRRQMKYFSTAHPILRHNTEI